MIEQLEDYLFELKSELLWTPFFCIRAKWEIKAKIKSTQAIIKVLTNGADSGNNE